MLDHHLQTKLIALCHLLVDQHQARVLIPAYASSSGYWFGGGNMVAGKNGDLYLVGRYRNSGDSRTGLAAGSRGLELAIFRSCDNGANFEKVVSLGKEDLGVAGCNVLSIEGTALRFNGDKVELYVSTEKESVGYPSGFENFLKPGTGVWSIDRLTASSVEGLASASVKPVLASNDPATIHVKDPFLYESDDRAWLFFCSHPFSWTCSNTGYIELDSPTDMIASNRTDPVFDFFPRGNVWDVAMSRGTCLIDVPAVGAFSNQNIQLLFYDGGECVRDHTQHAESVARPRGHSCEELGGAAWSVEKNWNQLRRLSKNAPLFVSPHGTGCSRYVDVLSRPEGMHVTWQQSQPDTSQPLVYHFVPRATIESTLS
ncbi:MAG: hypothetical protein KDB00_25155 [Planctomycetales bacterium]|nr:hypothetical protein [Planctomycetales bacterium]